MPELVGTARPGGGRDVAAEERNAPSSTAGCRPRRAAPAVLASPAGGAPAIAWAIRRTSRAAAVSLARAAVAAHEAADRTRARRARRSCSSSGTRASSCRRRAVDVVRRAMRVGDGGKDGVRRPIRSWAMAVAFLIPGERRDAHRGHDRRVDLRAGAAPGLSGSVSRTVRAARARGDPPPSEWLAERKRPIQLGIRGLRVLPRAPSRASRTVSPAGPRRSSRSRSRSVLPEEPVPGGARRTWKSPSGRSRGSPLGTASRARAEEMRARLVKRALPPRPSRLCSRAARPRGRPHLWPRRRARASMRVPLGSVTAFGRLIGAPRLVRFRLDLSTRNDEAVEGVDHGVSRDRDHELRMPYHDRPSRRSSPTSRPPSSARR